MTPPFIPEIQNEIDIKYFDKYEDKQPWIYNPNDPNYKKDFNFVGYTYKEGENGENEGSAHIYNKAIQRVEAEKKIQMENEKEWLETIKNNMKKKKTINLNDSKVYLKKKLP